MRWFKKIRNNCLPYRTIDFQLFPFALFYYFLLRGDFVVPKLFIELPYLPESNWLSKGTKKSLSFNTFCPLGEKHNAATNDANKQDYAQNNQKYMPPEPPFTAMTSK